MSEMSKQGTRQIPLTLPNICPPYSPPTKRNMVLFSYPPMSTLGECYSLSPVQGWILIGPNQQGYLIPLAVIGLEVGVWPSSAGSVRKAFLTLKKRCESQSLLLQPGSLQPQDHKGHNQDDPLSITSRMAAHKWKGLCDDTVVPLS